MDPALFDPLDGKKLEQSVSTFPARIHEGKKENSTASKNSFNLGNKTTRTSLSVTAAAATVAAAAATTTLDRRVVTTRVL